MNNTFTYDHIGCMGEYIMYSKFNHQHKLSRRKRFLSFCLFSWQYVFSKVRDTEKYDLPTLLKDDVFCFLCNEVLFHVHILDDLTNIYESTKERVQEEHDEHAALRMMKVALKQFYLEFCYSRTKYVLMCVCICSHYLMQKNSWSMMMVLNDIKVQIIMNLCKCLLYSAPGSTTRTRTVCAMDLESFFTDYLFWNDFLLLSKVVLIS